MFGSNDYEVYGGSGNSIYPGFLQHTDGSFTGVLKKGYLLRPPDANPPDTLSISLYDKVPFSDHLSIASQRIQARPWPNWPQGVNLDYVEQFGEYQGALPLDGKWHALPNGVPFYGPPYFGPFSFGDSKNLWSGWYYATTEEGGPWVDTPYSFPNTYIIGRRCRFRVSGTVVPYFIAMATINRVSGYGGAGDGPDSLWNIRQLSAGMTVSGQIYEIPWPPNDPGDFQTSQLFTIGTQTLSCGACTFAVVGETINAWRARTGFVVNG